MLEGILAACTILGGVVAALQLWKVVQEKLGFEQSFINRLNAFAAISEKYAALRKAGQVFFVIL